MTFTEQILASKLSIPIHPDLFISPRLSGLTARMAKKRLTVVTAGAGCGKTALTAWGLGQADVTPVWYTPDDTDRDFSRFIRYVAAGFRPHTGKNSGPVERLIAGAPFAAVHRQQVLASLVHTLESTPDSRLCLVLDDFHTVLGETKILESVEFLIRHLPQWIHIILLSRTDPGISLSRLRLTGQVTEITQADLLFTPGETREFLTGHLRPALSPKLAKQLYGLSNGWVTGLVLFYLGLKDNPYGTVPPQGTAGSNKLVFAYFEETVFRSLAPETREFMLRTSLPDTLEPAFCDALLDITGSGRILDHLVRGHLLTCRSGSGPDASPVYAYHQLMRAFLRDRLARTLPGEAVARLYFKTAGLLASAGDELQAVHAYISGGFFDIAVQRLMTVEGGLFKSGQLLRVSGFLDGFPKRFIRSSPQLQYIKARLASFSGDPHRAVSLYASVLSRSAPPVPGALRLNCRIELGLNYYYTGHIREAESLLETCMTSDDPGKRIEIAGLLILIYAIRGKIRGADQMADTVQKDISHLPDAIRLGMKNWIEFILSYRYFVSGDFRRAYAAARKSLDRYAGTDTDILMPLVYLHGALPAYFLEKYNIGHAWAEKGLALIRDMGVRDNQEGWLLYASALHLCGLNRLDQALARAGKGMSRFRHQANYWGQANMHDLIHFIRMKQGDHTGAQKALEKGLALLQGTGLTLTRGILETGLLGVWFETGRYEAVMERVPRVLEKVRVSDFYTYKTLVLSARCRGQMNDRAGAAADMDRALEIAAQYGYTHPAAGAGPWEPVPPLRISLLGRFGMALGGRNLAPDTFKNANALMMIKYLAVHHSKGFTQRDELIELLWPEQEFEKTRKRFNVLVSAVRKFFEPGIRRGEPSQYLKKQGTAFRLSPGPGGTVDVTAFRVAVDRGNRAPGPKEALPHYETALALYNGPFLAEDTYVQWCLEERGGGLYLPLGRTGGAFGLVLQY